MRFSVIIPARFNSTRLPGKSLLPIAGMPMIVHTLRCAQRSGAYQVIVATDDLRICDAVHAAGGIAVLTHDNASGSDRVYEAAAAMGCSNDDVIVNVQGDEPLIAYENINQVAKLLAKNTAVMASLYETMHDPAQIADANNVKVVTDTRGRALYFSRAAIPFIRSATQPPAKKHIGIYAYRFSFLAQYTHWKPTILERSEQLEQLRALENGAAIYLAKAQCAGGIGVDTQEDLQRAEQQYLLRNNHS